MTCWGKYKHGLLHAQQHTLYFKWDLPLDSGSHRRIGVSPKWLLNWLQDGAPYGVKCQHCQIASTTETVWQAQSLLALERDLATAEERLVDALTAAESACSRFAQLETCRPKAYSLVEWAETHIARNEPADQRRAKDLYHEALTKFQEMGNPCYANLREERILNLQ